MIPDEAVEAAVHAYMQYPRARGMDNTENMFRAALEAAAPHIQAQGLEEAATELDDKRLLPKAFHIFYPEWLRERASTYRTTK